MKNKINLMNELYFSSLVLVLLIFTMSLDIISPQFMVIQNPYLYLFYTVLIFSICYYCITGIPLIKRKVNNRKFLKLMHYYFIRNEDTMYENEYSITSVDVFKNKFEYNITITTKRPGILIGKAGKYIDGLIEHMNEELDKPVKIHIKECKLWSKLYD